MQRAQHLSTLVLNGALVLLGLIMAGLALARGGGPLALGVIVGVLFAVLGGARLWLALRGGSGGWQ